MDKQAQDIAARTLASIEDVRRACEGKPRKGEDGLLNTLEDIFGGRMWSPNAKGETSDG